MFDFLHHITFKKVRPYQFRGKSDHQPDMFLVDIVHKLNKQIDQPLIGLRRSTVRLPFFSVEDPDQLKGVHRAEQGLVPIEIVLRLLLVLDHVDDRRIIRKGPGQKLQPGDELVFSVKIPQNDATGIAVIWI